MDPKSSTQLDPKLQEAYNRVMGTPTGATAATDPTATPLPGQAAPAQPTDSTQGPVMPNVTPVADTTPPPAVIPAPDATTTSVSPAPVEPTPVTPTDPGATPITPVPTVVETAAPTMTTVENTASVKSQTFSAKKGMKVSPVILIVGAVVFLLVYTLVWVKVFNLSIPFINQ